MNYEELKKFCSTDITRPNLELPFSQGGYTWAADGRILIRVPEIPGIPVPEFNVPDVVSTFDRGWSDRIGFEPVEFPPGWESFEQPMVPCSDCKGLGHFAICQECKGEGEVECGHCGHNEDCEECDGIGQLPAQKGPNTRECHECEGAGEYEGGFTVSLNRGKILSALKYLRLVATLPHWQLWFYDGENPMRISFHGGQGLLMPMRRAAMKGIDALTLEQWGAAK